MPQTRINGLIHLTRTAFAHLTDNLVTLVNEGTWLKHCGGRFVVTTVATEKTARLL